MQIKDHEENESILGKTVLNFKKTQTGIVTRFNPDDRYPSIDIEWKDGKTSYACFMMCLELEIVN